MRKGWLFVSVCCLILFAVLSKYEDRQVLRNLDFAVTVKVQERIDTSTHLRLSSLVGNIMEGATFFASPEFTVVATLILSALAFRKTKKALLIPVFLALLVVVEIYAKSIVHHPSPPFNMIKNPTTIFPANYINEQFSYPSGHAARAVFLAVLFYSLFTIHYSLRDKTMRFAMACGLTGYVLLVGISRVYLGHHWASDVVGGILLGSGCAVSILALVRARNV